MMEDGVLDHWTAPFYHKVAISTVAALYFVIAITSSVMFHIYAFTDQELSRRSPSLTVMGGIANAFASLDFLLHAAFPNQFPCFLTFWAAYLGVVMLLLSLIGRSMRLLMYWRLNLIKSSEKGLLKAQSSGRYADNMLPNNQSIIDRNIWVGIIIFLILSFVHTTILQFTQRTSPEKLSVAVYPTISYACPSFNPYWPFYVFICLFILVVSPLTVFLTWKTRDNYGIRNDVIISVLVGIPMYLMYFIWLKVPSIFRYYFPNLLWVWFSFLAIHTTSVILPLARSYCRRQNGVESKYDWNDFERMIMDPSLFSAFVKHSVEDFCAENTRFIEEYQALRAMTVEGFRLIDSISPDEQVIEPIDFSKVTSVSLVPPTVSIATSIMAKSKDDLRVPGILKNCYTTFYTMFVCSGSVLEVNLKSATRREIVWQISNDSFNVTVFDNAMKEVLDLLFFDTFPKFYTKRKQILIKKRRAWYRPFLPQRENDMPLTRFA